MSSRQLRLIQESYLQITPIADQVAARFYTRLFAQEPALRPLFKTDMDLQKVKLMTMLAFVVDNLLQLDELIPTIQALGQRHVEYGVAPEHYEPLGEALLWALAQSLGDAFTPEVRAAWQGVYTLLANTMISAARL
jgi:hemoglobin-like flavoprotein